MKIRHVILLVLVSLVSAATFSWYFSKNSSLDTKPALAETAESGPFVNVGQEIRREMTGSVDFVEASTKSTPSVVFVRTESEAQQRSSFWLFDFDPFGRMGKVSTTGSGVIVSEDGYIVTNFHVVKNADKIEVVLDQGKRTYQATVIGTAASSDLALLKVDAHDLPAISIGNSDHVKIGEWVLAVGNPFNLTSTVTAGIVSAKGRNINIVENRFPIESFIQTDAAINPGNSGGALVDLHGNLIGVNTAIASKTGSYVGYGFAIPVNIVVKIVDDLKEYQQIQRGFDGLDVLDMSEQLIDEKKISDGVYIAAINGTNEAASESFKPGDVIIEVNGQKIKNKAGYHEFLAYHRPGDKIEYRVVRDGESKKIELTLVNDEGTTELVKRFSLKSKSLGAEFEKISKLERDLYNISDGIVVSNITQGKIREMRLEDGFIFTQVNDMKPKDLAEFVDYLEKVKGQVRIQGISTSGRRQFLSFYIY